jgi:uncharacterized protein with HEPN domain
MTKKDDRVFIEHILESIEAIQEFSKDMDLDELSSNRMKRNAIFREIEIIGEASKNLSNNLKKKYKQIPWKEIAGTRDKLIYHYFGVNLELLFKTIEEDIPKLKKQIEKIKENLAE